MKNRIAVALFVLLSIFAFATSYAAAQESSESARKILTRVAPQYPSLARSMNIKGSVRAVALVAPNGTVKSVEVKGGHPVLAEAAQNALRQWKFEPASRETYEIIEIRFAP
ncbi:MAG TPA: energy transducer TonB [Candidatus Acidoferrum sp.]|jgi:TonB family protein|nr:energy transducer TonB [Candidatus Acidoferrum sp.]